MLRQRLSLITDHGLSSETRRLAGTTFFERLFDEILGIQSWDDFPTDKCEQVALPLSLIEELIDVYFEWDDFVWNSSNLSSEARAMYHFIWWGRYGDYNFLVYYFIHRFHSWKTRAELEDFIVELSKLLLVYSVCFRKVTNECRQKMRQLMDRLSRAHKTTEPTDIINHLAQERAEFYEDILCCLRTEPFAYIPTGKTIVCWLDAMLAELGAGTDAELLIEQLLGGIDIEHIQSVNHEDDTEWGEELNQLGNLIVLESSLNRSLGNNDYASTKRDIYMSKDSKFQIVQNFAHTNEQWNPSLARKRCDDVAKRLADYLCGDHKGTLLEGLLLKG